MNNNIKLLFTLITTFLLFSSYLIQAESINNANLKTNSSLNSKNNTITRLRQSELEFLEKTKDQKSKSKKNIEKNNKKLIEKAEKENQPNFSKCQDALITMQKITVELNDLKIQNAIEPKSLDAKIKSLESRLDKAKEQVTQYCAAESSNQIPNIKGNK